ncbi:hypothetical protein [Bacillus cereus]|uniref:hypothetical protein n=1 Tax=Bacillus cereus TaxID=1396 RepID=UPI001C8B2A4E|nr:hypothetical protein [Bacillus cereus]MBX9158489.1 hypothetical protein [Bacillus cereus]
MTMGDAESMFFRLYMVNGKMDVLCLTDKTVQSFEEDYFMTDEDGRILQFDNEDAAVDWLLENIKPDLLAPSYRNKVINPKQNREYWLKGESGLNGETFALDMYRLYVTDGKVGVVCIEDGDESNYDKGKFITERDGSSLVFYSEPAAVEWMLANVKHGLIHREYVKTAASSSDRVSDNLNYWLN